MVCPLLPCPPVTSLRVLHTQSRGFERPAPSSHGKKPKCYNGHLSKPRRTLRRAPPVHCACTPSTVRCRLKLKRKPTLTWCHLHARSEGCPCGDSALLLPGRARPARALLPGRPFHPAEEGRASAVEAGMCPCHRCQYPCHSCKKFTACVSGCQGSLRMQSMGAAGVALSLQRLCCSGPPLKVDMMSCHC